MPWTQDQDQLLLEMYNKYGAATKIKDVRTALQNPKLTAKQIRSRIKHLRDLEPEAETTESITNDQSTDAIVNENVPPAKSIIKERQGLLSQEKVAKKSIDLAQEPLPKGNVKKVVESFAAVEVKKPLVEVSRTRVGQTVQQIETLTTSPVTRRAARLQRELGNETAKVEDMQPMNQDEEVKSVSGLKQKYESGKASAVKGKSTGITPGRTAALKSRKVSRAKSEGPIESTFVKEPAVVDMTPSREAAVKAKTVTKTAKSRLKKSVKVTEAESEPVVENTQDIPKQEPLLTPTKEKPTPTSSPLRQKTPFARKLRYEPVAASPLRKSVSADDIKESVSADDIVNEDPMSNDKEEKPKNDIQEENPFDESVLKSQDVDEMTVVDEPPVALGKEQVSLEPSRKRKRESEDVQVPISMNTSDKRIRVSEGTFSRVQQQPEPVLYPLERLSVISDTIPRRYNLYLDVDPFQKRYSGTVSIYVSLTTQRIELNSKVEILRLTVDEQQTEYYLHGDKLVINGIDSGDHIIRIDFEGDIRSGQSGFFADTNNVMISHFEPIKARTVFPCFDEPMFKAEFEVSVRVPSQYHVLSNTLPMSISKVSDISTDGTPNALATNSMDEGDTLYEFEKTIPLPTYLVAWAIFDNLKVVEQQINGTLVRIYYHPNQTTIAQANYALETATRCVKYFSTTLFALPLKKIDLVSIKNFHAEGMENMGLITIDSIALQVDSQSLPEKKRYAALLITHEIAHHYFGNLATLQEWRELWLNEGFAEFMQYLATDSIFPDLNVLEYFFSTEHEEALQFDSSRYSHPIQPPAFDGFLFDGITYNKGASCLWMMYHYIEANTKNCTLNQGLEQYLREHPFGVVTTDDLLFLLTRSTGLDLAKVFGPWIASKGYPVLSISHSQNTMESVTFSLGVTLFQRWKDDSLLDRPLILNATILLQNNHTYRLEGFTVELGHSKGDIDFQVPAGWKFVSILVNPSRVWFHRTLYSSTLHTQLDAHLRLNSGISDRMGLISDTVSLTLAGYYPLESGWFNEFQDGLSFMVYERSVDVWSFFLDQIFQLESALRNTKYHVIFGNWLITLIEPLMSEMTWKISDHPLNSIKSKLFLAAIRVEHKGTIDEARHYFGRSDFDPLLTVVATEAAVRYDKQFDQVWKQMTQAKNFEFVAALAATNDKKEQIKLIHSFKGTPYFYRILQRLIDYGNHRVVWNAIKDFEFGNSAKYDLLLERTVSLFDSRRLMKDAKRYDGEGVKRGLERAKALQQFRLRINQ